MNKAASQGRPHQPEAPVQANPLAGDGAGLGLDIVEIDRMERVLARTPAFRMRVFSEGERAHCDKTANPPVHYAMRFAAKQAVLKALGKHIFSGIALADVEIVRPLNSRPVARLHGKAAVLARESGVTEIPVSLSFTHSEAVACAMAITSDALPGAQKREDPKSELAAQFKAARSFLDDLPARKAGDPDPGDPQSGPQGLQPVSQDPLPGSQDMRPGAGAAGKAPGADAAVKDAGSPDLFGTLPGI